MTRIERFQEVLEKKSRRWWFFVVLIASQFLIVPFASQNFDIRRCGNIIHYTLGHSLFLSCKPFFPVFQAIAIVMLLLLLILRNRFRAMFSLYVGFSYMLFAVVQNIAIGPKYGVSIVTINLIMFPLVASTWFWEAAAQVNDFSSRDHSLWKWLLVPLALIAFWLPINMTTGKPDFNPVYFLTSGSALTFCLMTPVYLSVLLFFYPWVNMLTLRVTSAVGLIIGLYNVIPKLILQTHSTWWDGILHLPLFVLSFLGVVASMKRTHNEGHKKSMNYDKQ